MSVRTISIHSVQEIDLEVSFAHVERLQIEKSAAEGVRFIFHFLFLPPSLMQKLSHDPRHPPTPQLHPSVKREVAVGSMARPSVFASLSPRRQTSARKKQTANSKLKRVGGGGGVGWGGGTSALLALAPASDACRRRSAQLCPNSLWNEDGGACVCGEQFPPRAGAGGRGTGARMLAYACVRVRAWVCVRLHCAPSPLLFPECEAHTTERDRGLGGEPECLGSKSIRRYVGASVRCVLVFLSVFFFFPACDE